MSSNNDVYYPSSDEAELQRAQALVNGTGLGDTLHDGEADEFNSFVAELTGFEQQSKRL